jgi:hypothetical protein
MQKLKYILPVGQVILAIILLGWGHTVKVPKRTDLIYVPTPTLVLMGINAPVLLVRPLMALITPGTPTNHRPGPFFDFTGDEILFICVSAAMWYVIAVLLASHLPVKLEPIGRANIARFIWFGVFALVGITLAAGGIEMLRFPGEWNNAVGQTFEGVLFLLWAIALLLPLLVEFRRRTVRVAQENSAS